jgi:hypothetical protein
MQGSDGNNNVEKPWVREVVFGLFFHDTGPINDKNEAGGDLIWSSLWKLALIFGRIRVYPSTWIIAV